MKKLIIIIFLFPSLCQGQAHIILKTKKKKKVVPVIEQTLSMPFVKIPVAEIINPTLTANENAFIDEQSSNELVGGKSNPSKTPAVCNNWWDPQAVNSTCVQIQHHPNRINNLPGKITYDFKFNGSYILQKICIFVVPNNTPAPDNAITFKTGEPFNFTSTIATIADSGAIGTPHWLDIDVNNKSTQYVQIEYGQNFGTVREVVYYGQRVGLEPVNEMADYSPVKTFDSTIATNIVFQMGQSSDSKNYDSAYYGGLRWFAAAAYLLKKDLSFKHPSGTGNDVEVMFNNRIVGTGSNLHYAFGSLVDSSMITPTNNSGGDWAAQKPINTNLINEATADRLYGICTFNEIAENPQSYAQAAWNLKRFAAAYYLLGHKAIEPDNEKDGTFKGAGFMYPYQQAAMLSAYYDGHNNTVKFNGQSVGVRNTGLTVDQIKLISPGLANINPTYIRAMLYWFKWRRANGTTPFDIFNVHCYPTTLGMQFSGDTGRALMPESNLYHLEQKLDTAKYFANLMKVPLINTESGFDVYPEIQQYPSEYCPITNKYGGSFMAIHAFGGKSEADIQGEWLLRNYLLHNSRGIVYYQYWLADQYKSGTTCGTFNASGLLSYDTVINWKPLYKPRPAWYYLTTAKSVLAGYKFTSESKNGNIRQQLYTLISDPAKKAFVVWYATDNNSSSAQVINFSKVADYKIITLNNSTTGSSSTGTGNSVTVTINELPKIILFQ